MSERFFAEVASGRLVSQILHPTVAGPSGFEDCPCGTLAVPRDKRNVDAIIR
jgi:hypothetical protein